MCAPSACNQQPWKFVIIDDCKLLREVPAINSYASMAAAAPVAILVCGDESYHRLEPAVFGAEGRSIWGIPTSL